MVGEMRAKTFLVDILLLLKYKIALANSLSAMAGYFIGGGEFKSAKLLFLVSGIFF